MDLSGSPGEFNDQTFRKLVHKGQRFTRQEFEACTFIKCVFSESVFEKCTFRGCVFKDCELNLIQIAGCSFSDIRFEQSQLVGVNWTETNLADHKSIRVKPVKFEGCAINHSLMMWLNLKDLVLTRCTARDTDFSEADLTQANCAYTDFANSRFWHTNLTGADFTGASNYTIAANLNTLKQTKFSLPEAMALLYSLDIILDEAR